MINEYLVRKVALKDMQPCLICGKPSTTVLFNGSGPDFFYTCDIHLKDNPQFVTPLYSKEYEAGLRRLKDLKSQINSTATKKPGSWDGWVSSIFVKSTQKKEDINDTTDAVEIDKTAEAKEFEKEEDSPTDKSKVLQKQYSEQLDLVADLHKKNRKYQLSKVTFESRVMRKRNEQRQAEKRRIEQEAYTHTNPDDLMQRFSFPTVPKNWASTK